MLSFLQRVNKDVEYLHRIGIKYPNNKYQINLMYFDKLYIHIFTIILIFPADSVKISHISGNPLYIHSSKLEDQWKFAKRLISSEICKFKEIDNFYPEKQGLSGRSVQPTFHYGTVGVRRVSWLIQLILLSLHSPPLENPAFGHNACFIWNDRVGKENYC